MRAKKLNIGDRIYMISLISGKHVFLGKVVRITAFFAVISNETRFYRDIYEDSEVKAVGANKLPFKYFKK